MRKAGRPAPFAAALLCAQQRLAGGFLRTGSRRAPVLLLVVDDNRELCDALAATLREAGHATLRAYDAAGGIDALRRAQVALALIEFHLPGPVSGVDVAKAAAAQGAQVIMMTGVSYGDDLLSRLPYHYLLKPVRPDQLLRLVSEVLPTAG